MIELKRRQLVIDGEPRILLCGEVHYFRIPPARWQHTLDLAKEAGINTIATYIPWHMHEEIEGAPDYVGRTRPELDLVGFLRLVQANGFDIFFRPGPFIMAEMKNEGIPYWLRAKHPHLIPVSWDGKTVPTSALDYTHPDFLAEARNYYRVLMRHVKPFLRSEGGRIVAIQLDNEIGMLSWVSNAPDLTDFDIEAFTKHVQTVYGAAAAARYPFLGTPAFAAAIRHPEETFAARIHFDLGVFNRRRFTEYARALQAYMAEAGVRDIPYVINVHGTSDGRALLFPIGLSQLKDAFDHPNLLAGSDLYLGEFGMSSFHDFYVVNGMQESLNRHGQPLAAVEFNCGDGNWGDSLSTRLDPSSTSLKTRICLAHGHKMISYYLLAGGVNARMNVPPGDGNDRIAITGERHGFAAPISPEGTKNITFDRLAEVNRVTRANESLLAPMRLEPEPVAMGWIPDYFMTESRHPGSGTMRELYGGIESHRAGIGWNVFTKMLLLRHANPAVVNLQDPAQNAAGAKFLYVESARWMPRDAQTRLADHVRAGGTLVLFGELPRMDLEADPCTILADALGVTPGAVVTDRHGWHLSVVPDGWLKGLPEHQIYDAATVDAHGGTPLYRIYGTGEVCAFDKPVGKGRVIAFLTQITAGFALLDRLFAQIGYAPALQNDYVHHGVVVLPTRSPSGRMLHVLNVDDVDKTFLLSEHGKPLFEGRPVSLPRKEGLMLPYGIKVGPFRIAYATLEAIRVEADAVTFRGLPGDHAVRLFATRPITATHGANIADAALGERIVTVRLTNFDPTFTIAVRS